MSKVVMVVLMSLLVASVVMAGVTVENAALCTGVEDHEPIGSASSFSADVGKVYLWTKILSDEIPSDIKHVWYYGDEKIADVPLNIKYKSTRTYSYKTIMPEWMGDWHVEVVDSEEKVLKKLDFTIVSKQEIDEANINEVKQEESEVKEETEKFKEPSETGLKVEMKIGTGIDEREIIGEGESFGAEVGKIYVWCVVEGAQEPTTIKHVWYYKGNNMAEIPLSIKYARHRTWTFKTIMPQWVGDWEVQILDQDDKLLTKKAFKITSN
jgi:hypothetical protein